MIHIMDFRNILTFTNWLERTAFHQTFILFKADGSCNIMNKQIFNLTASSEVLNLFS